MLEPDNVLEQDSDEAIIHSQEVDNQPSKPLKPQRKCKSKAIFTIHTIGIKIQKDAQLVINARRRQFTCILFCHKADSTKILNFHFKNMHNCLKCDECKKEYLARFSLKKHMYVHKSLEYSCSHCEQRFPCKLQRDGHENLHTDKSWHACTRPNCKSSFSRLSDLKLHEAKHDQDPIKSEYYDYENCDKCTTI